MSFRIKKYRLTCSKIGCEFNKTLPLYSSKDQYLLSDNTKISVNYFRKDGWCNTCQDYRQLFSPKSLEQIKIEVNAIENRFNNSGFLGFNKKRLPEDVELFDLNNKILDVLRRRTVISNICTICRGSDLAFWDTETFIKNKISHPNCSGHFKIEEGVLIIGSNLGYGGTSFSNLNETEFRHDYINWTRQKGNLFDSNDNILMSN
jgi:hypothetical protein